MFGPIGRIRGEGQARMYIHAGAESRLMQRSSDDRRRYGLRRTRLPVELMGTGRGASVNGPLTHREQI